MTDYQRRFAEENHNLILSFLKKYKLDYEEYYDLAAIGFCKAIVSFKIEASKFATYAYKCMWNEIYNDFEKKNGKRKVPSEMIVYGQNTIESEDGSERSIFDSLPSKKHNTENEALANVCVENILIGMTDRDRKIAVFIMNGYTQKEIADEMGCTQAGVSWMKKEMKKYIVY